MQIFGRGLDTKLKGGVKSYLQSITGLDVSLAMLWLCMTSHAPVITHVYIFMSYIAASNVALSFCRNIISASSSCLRNLRFKRHI